MNAKRRARLSSAVAFLCGSNKLKSQQEMLEKMQEKLISALKSFSVLERNELLGLMKTLERDTNKDIEEMQDELLGIFDLLKEITHEINDEEKLKAHDISYFRQKLKELEVNIHRLKENCTKELKKLEDEELTSMMELEIMESRIEEWGKVNELTRARRAKSASKVDCTCSADDLCPEIRDFSNFVQRRGGHYGGWKEDDHLLYLRLRQKHNSEETAALLNQRFPDLTGEKVLEHDAWFEAYTDLKNRQQLAIKNWRAGQKANHTSECNEYEEPKKQKKQLKYKTDPELREKIKLWQEQQKNKKEYELKEKMEEEEMKKKLNQLWRQKHEKRRAFVNEYKHERMSCEQAMQIARQTEDEKRRQLSAQQANQMLRQFRNEDIKYMIRRKEILQQKQDSETRSTTSSSSSSVKAARDPERLFQPTEVWRLKTAKSDSNPQLNRPVIHLRNMPHLKVPKWRQGLSSDVW